jgi:hypothetical protein
MQELIPKEPDFGDRVLEYSDQLDDFLSEAAKVAKNINRVPRKVAQRERFMQALAEAFEIVGGVPRLALWADKNQTEFYKLLGKQVPGLVQNAFAIKTNGPVTIMSAIPPSFLDDAHDDKVVNNE